jgi:glutamate carboxypeptidase
MKPDLRAYFDRQTDDMVALLADLIAIESPTTDKAAVDRMSGRVAAELEALGASLQAHPRGKVGDIIEAGWHLDRPGKPILFLCHMDTVHPVGAIADNPVREEEGRLYGPGAYDMKASITAVLHAIRGLQELSIFPERPIIALMTTDEETGSYHSRALIEELAAGAALVCVMEPALPDGSLKTWRKATGMFNVRAHGIASHAGGAHEMGLNAIEEMAHQILELQGMTDYEVGTTVSVGMVEGGTARNVVPESCELAVDVRAMNPGEMARLTERILALKPVLPGARLEVSGEFDRPPMERNALMIQTFGRAKQIAARHGFTLRESGSGGGSDGNFTAALGTPTLDGLGPIGDGAHTASEHLIINSLGPSAALLAALLLGWPRE